MIFLAISVPSISASSMGHDWSSLMASLPSGRRTSPRSRRVDPLSSASPAMGVSQDPSRPRKNARSAASR
jgi:hypothetical protein